MIRSMTGFARTETQSPVGPLLWELRSVNHRYLETQIRLPEGFRAIEPAARQIIAGGVRRGKLDASLTSRTGALEHTQGQLDLDYARELIGHARHLATVAGNAAPIDPVDILRWPGVLREPEASLEPVFPLALDGLTRAVSELAASREREGSRLREMLETRCTEILTRVAAVEQRLPIVLASIRDKLDERVRSLAASIEPGRLEQEIVLIAQKLDVSEELDRLRSHVTEFRAAMARGDEAAGRRLDFLLQEFNREANTLASKSADAETTRQAVDLKVLIEQMREQVQNVE
ncbi:MAG: YicC/YloC family endoribonuclease [Gammaproteobacteria bacterium]|nr:MAG: YicC/YloC family endoribonuclease [Gammaproteobacteria bacterium]